MVLRWLLFIPFSESTTHVPFVLVHKKKSAVNHRRWFSTDCYLFPSQKVLPMYLLYLCIKKKSAVNHRRWFSADLIIPFSEVLPMYLLYLCIKKCQRSTIDDGSPLTACLRSLNYSLLRCTTRSRRFRIEFGIPNEIIRKYSETAWKFGLCHFLCRKKLGKLDLIIFNGGKRCGNLDFVIF